MAKPVKALLKLQIPGGGATPAPPVGSALGQYGVNIMDFVQAFNNDTASRQGETVPVEITIYMKITLLHLLQKQLPPHI